MRPGRASRVARALGLALVVLGLLALAWAVVVWRWQDPVTAVYTIREQHHLRAELARRFRPVTPAGSRVTASVPGRGAIAAAARRYRKESHEGEPIGWILVPRLGLRMILVDGTDESTLEKGPGRDLRSFMPGEDNLVYVAGHRTTFLAPFARIDRMRDGDPITIEMPYGTFHYATVAERIVPADDLAVLRSRTSELLVLQACHPRFSATHRYLVEARLLSITSPVRPGS